MEDILNTVKRLGKTGCMTNYPRSDRRMGVQPEDVLEKILKKSQHSIAQEG